LHEKRLDEHPFVADHDKSELSITPLPDLGILLVEGVIYCKYNIILEFRKVAELRSIGSRLQVRTFSFAYNAWIEGKHNVLRYDNGHDNPDEYHRHIFDLDTGEEIEKEFRIMTREEFPVMHEVLDELQAMFAPLNAS